MALNSLFLSNYSLTRRTIVSVSGNRQTIRWSLKTT